MTRRGAAKPRGRLPDRHSGDQVWNGKKRHLHREGGGEREEQEDTGGPDRCGVGEGLHVEGRQRLSCEA